MRDPRASSDLDSVEPVAAGLGEDEGFGELESDELAAEAARGRTLDGELAAELEHRAARTRAISGSYLHGLGRRARMPEAVEQVLVREAIAGDPKARGALVEAFLPLIASVARNYRSSRQI